MSLTKLSPATYYGIKTGSSKNIPYTLENLDNKYLYNSLACNGIDITGYYSDELIVRQLTGVSAGLVAIDVPFEYPSDGDELSSIPSNGGSGVDYGKIFVNGIEKNAWGTISQYGLLYWTTDNWKTVITDQSLANSSSSLDMYRYNLIKFVYAGAYKSYAWISACNRDAANKIVFALHNPNSYNDDGSIKASAWSTITIPWDTNGCGKATVDGNIMCYAGDSSSLGRMVDLDPSSFTKPLTSDAGNISGIETDHYGTWVVLTRNGTLYKSIDKGLTWNKITGLTINYANGTTGTSSYLPPGDSGVWGGLICSYGQVWVATIGSDPAKGQGGSKIVSYAYSTDLKTWNYYYDEYAAIFYGAGFDGTRWYGCDPRNGIKYTVDSNKLTQKYNFDTSGGASKLVFTASPTGTWYIRAIQNDGTGAWYETSTGFTNDSTNTNILSATSKFTLRYYNDNGVYNNQGYGFYFNGNTGVDVDDATPRAEKYYPGINARYSGYIDSNNYQVYDSVNNISNVSSLPTLTLIFRGVYYKQTLTDGTIVYTVTKIGSNSTMYNVAAKVDNTNGTFYKKIENFGFTTNSADTTLVPSSTKYTITATTLSSSVPVYYQNNPSKFTTQKTPTLYQLLLKSIPVHEQLACESGLSVAGDIYFNDLSSGVMTTDIHGRVIKTTADAVSYSKRVLYNLTPKALTPSTKIDIFNVATKYAIRDTAIKYTMATSGSVTTYTLDSTSGTLYILALKATTGTFYRTPTGYTNDSTDITIYDSTIKYTITTLSNGYYKTISSAIVTYSTSGSETQYSLTVDVNNDSGTFYTNSTGYTSDTTDTTINGIPALNGTNIISANEISSNSPHKYTVEYSGYADSATTWIFTLSLVNTAGTTIISNITISATQYFKRFLTIIPDYVNNKIWVIRDSSTAIAIDATTFNHALFALDNQVKLEITPGTATNPILMYVTTDEE